MNGGDIHYVDCKVVIKDDRHAEYQDEYGHKAKGAILDDDLTHSTVQRIRYWIATNDQCERADLMLLGQHLYRLLFHRHDGDGDGETIGDEFEAFYAAFEHQLERDPNQRLRLTLVFHREAEKTAAYPWEFLYMPRRDQGFFLAGERTHLILTRFVPETDIVETLEPEDRPLRILVAYSSPYEEPEIEAKEVIDSINALKDEGISVEVLENKPRRELTETINRYKPHIFHFIGHGKEGQIALIKDEEKIQEELDLDGVRLEAEWCDTATVNEMFADHKPRLVFLHACKGAAPFGLDALQSLTSTARELVYAKIPAVIGMQFEIENADAAAFTKLFYQALGEGKPVDEAVTIGRRELGQYGSKAWGDRRFGTPLIYLQTGNPIIVASPAAERDDRDDPVAADDLAVSTCPYPPCRQAIRPEFPRCPACGNRIRRCVNNHPVAVHWQICPYCDERLKPEASAHAVGDAATMAPARAGVAAGGPSQQDDATFG